MSDAAPPPPPPEPVPSWMQSPPPAYGYANGAVVPREHPQGTMILVFGILGIVGTCGLLGPVAWYMGTKALAEIDANPGAYTNRSNVNAGRILGMITSILLIVVVVGAVLLIVLASAASVSSSG